MYIIISVWQYFFTFFSLCFFQLQLLTMCAYISLTTLQKYACMCDVYVRRVQTKFLKLPTNMLISLTHRIALPTLSCQVIPDR